MFKVNNRNTRTRCEICSKLTIKFEHISQLILVFMVKLSTGKCQLGYSSIGLVTALYERGLQFKPSWSLMQFVIFFRWLTISHKQFIIIISAGIYLLKVNIRNTKTRCEICSKLTTKTQEQRLVCGVFIVNFEHILHLVLVFLLLTLNW